MVTFVGPQFGLMPLPPTNEESNDIEFLNDRPTQGQLGLFQSNFQKQFSASQEAQQRLQTMEISDVTPGFEDKNPTSTPAKKHGTRQQTVGGGASAQMTPTPNPTDEPPKSQSNPKTPICIILNLISEIKFVF